MIRSMIRALLHVRLFFVLLTLSLATAFVTAPAMAAQAMSCAESASASHHAGKIDPHASDTLVILHHGDDVRPGNCCMPGSIAHCCGYAITANGDDALAISFATMKWRFLSEDRIAGMGSLGDFRPPRHIG